MPLSVFVGSLAGLWPMCELVGLKAAAADVDIITYARTLTESCRCEPILAFCLKTSCVSIRPISARKSFQNFNDYLVRLWRLNEKIGRNLIKNTKEHIKHTRRILVFVLHESSW